MTATPWASARLAAYAAADPIQPDTVPVPDALGLSLAEPLRAISPVPPFDCAAMDGYALGSERGPWRVIGRILAGHTSSVRLEPGTAAEIATGSPVPPGTVAVLPHEDATVHRPKSPTTADASGLDASVGDASVGDASVGDASVGVGSAGDVSGGDPSAGVGNAGDASTRKEIDGATGAEETITGESRPGRHLRRAGEDVPTGVDLVPAGAAVTPTMLGLAAAIGLDTVHVRTRPRVVALVTGDELISAGRPGAGLVRDAVGPQLPGLVRWLGGELTLVLPVPDTPAGQLAAALAAATPAEVVVTCGGASHGPADRITEALTELGARTIVAGVACRPGRPQRLARLPDGRWLVALPGNPYAALVAALTLLGPLLAGLCGRPLPVLPSAPLTAPPPPADDATRIIPVRRVRSGEVEPVGRDRAGNLWGASLADALAVVRPGWAGDPVPLLALPPA